MAGSFQMNVEIPATINAQAEPLRVVEAVSPTVTVEENEDGALITIHDLHGTTHTQINNGATGPQGERGEQGPQGIQGMQGERGEQGVQGEKGEKGEQGDPGPKGDTGAQGIQGPKGDKGDKGDTGEQGIQGIQGLKGDTGAQGAQGEPGTPGRDGAPGAPGTDGVSPSISVTDITGGHRVTITDATGAHSFDVMDGDSADAPVQDVQVNGVSVLSDGVANVPIASLSEPGVAKVSNTYGLDVGTSGQHVGFIRIVPAPTNRIKGGDGYYNPVTTNIQHSAAFYGLAKAAGSDEKNSTLPMGQYTDEAKIAIQKMLGLYHEWELIADVTIDEDTVQIDIVTDISGQPFALSRMLVRAWLQPATTGTNSYMSANCHVVNANDVNTLSSAPTKRYMANGAKTFFEYIAEIMGDVCYCTGAATSAPNSTGSVEKISSYVAIKHIRGFRMGRYGSDGSLVPAGSNIKVYGIRA